MCITGFTPEWTPATCATDVARTYMSWGLTPKTGPKRSAVERKLPHLCVPLWGGLSRCEREEADAALGTASIVTGERHGFSSPHRPARLRRARAGFVRRKQQVRRAR